MKKLDLEQLKELQQGDIVYIKRNTVENSELNPEHETVGFFTTFKSKSLVLKFNAYYVEHDTFNTDFYDVYLVSSKTDRENL